MALTARLTTIPVLMTSSLCLRVRPEFIQRLAPTSVLPRRAGGDTDRSAVQALQVLQGKAIDGGGEVSKQRTFDP